MKLTRRDLFRVTSGFATAALFRADADDSIPVQEISSASGLQVAVFSDGSYRIIAAQSGWAFDGAVTGLVDSISVVNGADAVGPWQEIDIAYEPGRISSIRLYAGKAVVLFSTTYGQATANIDPFPRFTSYPQGLFTFSYAGLWSYQFGALNSGSPWLFFDRQANAVLFSPAANFMTAVSQFGSENAIEGAIDGRIITLPAGFTHRAVLAFANGINTVFDLWGQTLTGLAGKNRTASDAITLLNRLSYWTDAGSAYYYQPQDGSQYVPTLLQIAPEFTRSSCPIGAMELDSWHYPKGSPPAWQNIGSGMATFRADPTLFPDGLAAFQQASGLSLVTHARWIDANSDLRDQYKMSGNVSIDPRYWADYANYLASSGVDVLEQDWLSGPAVTDFNLTDPDAFLDNMASAMQQAGRHIVYCMPLWAHIMQSTKYDNVVAARVSNDTFSRAHWDEVIFNSRIASAVGLWPFADTIASRNIKDVLIATLTAGPLGSGDPLGANVPSNLGRAVRADGVIVKPDVPIVPTDSTFLAMSTSSAAPMLAYTYTNHGALQTTYVLAYERAPGAQGPISFSPAEFGITNPAYVYDYFRETGAVVESGGLFTGNIDYDGSYFIVAPIGSSGIAFLGDSDKFVPCGKKRIEELSDDGGVLRVLVRFAGGEKTIALHLHAPSLPLVTTETGTAGPPIAVGVGRHRAAGGRYKVIVSFDPAGQAVVNFRLGLG